VKNHDARKDQSGEAYPCKQPSVVDMCSKGAMAPTTPSADKGGKGHSGSKDTKAAKSDDGRGHHKY